MVAILYPKFNRGTEYTHGGTKTRDAYAAAKAGRGGQPISMMDEMREFYDELIGGEDVGKMFGRGEGEEEVDWEEMWNMVIEEEEGYEEKEQQQGSQYPTMFGGPSRPGFNYY